MATIEDKAKALQQSKAEEFASACPSRVIEMALEDLEAVEKSERYAIDMGVWHCPEGPMNKCAVCWAGSVMANRLGADTWSAYEPDDFGPDTSLRLQALNLFRTGQIVDGLNAIGNFGFFTRDWHMGLYKLSPSGFKDRMRALAAMLRHNGL